MVFEKVKKIVASHTTIKIDEIYLDSSLTDDLEIDSIDAFEIMSEIEDEFNIEISEEELDNIKTIKDIVDYLESSI